MRATDPVALYVEGRFERLQILDGQDNGNRSPVLW